LNPQKEISRIKREKIESSDKTCKGCSETKVLTASHIIRKTARDDLKTSPDNITLHCVDCHAAWDSNDISRMIKLNDFADNMYYISQVDKSRFFRLMYKIQTSI